jgi:hypothetical protein
MIIAERLRAVREQSWHGLLAPREIAPQNPAGSPVIRELARCGRAREELCL